MPHLSLEYTRNLEIHLDCRTVLLEIHRVLQEELGTNIEKCKSRAIRRDSVLVGDGSGPEDFVHLSVKVFEGRSAEEKERLGSRLLEILLEHLSGGPGKGIQVTVEVSEMRRQEYFKAWT